MGGRIILNITHVIQHDDGLASRTGVRFPASPLESPEDGLIMFFESRVRRSSDRPSYTGFLLPPRHSKVLQFSQLILLEIIFLYIRLPTGSTEISSSIYLFTKCDPQDMMKIRQVLRQELADELMFLPCFVCLEPLQPFFLPRQSPVKQPHRIKEQRLHLLIALAII